jgi:hypothetical protein
VNATNGAAIRPLKANQTISLSDLGAPSISIQALTNSGTKSVKFEGTGILHSENYAPYALLGNSGSSYTAWTPKTGVYSITATGYSARNASGNAGKPFNITITIVP